uniref:Uncharacterized protein n=1 Tax=Panagrolaimus davidi TaxID=227884 RepID=A0A914PTR0_9BILA
MNRVPDRLWLTGNMILGDNINVSKLLSKIVRCDLCEIYLALDTKFTINDFAFLTQSGTVKSIICENGIYKSHKNDDVAPLEDILSCVLTADSIEFSNVYFAKETMKKLTLLNFHQKLTQFILEHINQMLDVNLMDHFLKKNLEDRACVSLNFNDENHSRIFKSQIFEKINAWFPKERKPRTFPKEFVSE